MGAGGGGAVLRRARGATKGGHLAPFELRVYSTRAARSLFGFALTALCTVAVRASIPDFKLCNGRLLLLVFAVLFEELVEQHRIHRLVADAVRFRLLRCGRLESGFTFATSSAIKPNCGVLAGLLSLRVSEAHRLEGQYCFAGFIHWLDVFLKPRRRSHRS